MDHGLFQLTSQDFSGQCTKTIKTTNLSSKKATKRYQSDKQHYKPGSTKVIKKTTKNMAAQTFDLIAGETIETVFDVIAKLNDGIEKCYYKKISMPVMFNKSFIMMMLTLIMMTNIQYMLIYIVFKISCHAISSMSCFDNRLKTLFRFI